MSRRKEREEVFQLLFEAEFHSSETPSVTYANALELRGVEETPYIRDTYFGAMERREDIDAQIAQNARKWKLSRMAAVTRSILRLAVYEILWGEVPPRAAINEAVELAKLYDEEAAPAFINGILNQIAKESGKLGETESEKTDDAELVSVCLLVLIPAIILRRPRCVMRRDVCSVTPRCSFPWRKGSVVFAKAMRCSTTSVICLPLWNSFAVR